MVGERASKLYLPQEIIKARQEAIDREQEEIRMRKLQKIQEKKTGRKTIVGGKEQYKLANIRDFSTTIGDVKIQNIELVSVLDN